MTIRALILTMSLLALVGCERAPRAAAPAPQNDDALVMRTYDVPPAYAAEVAAVINRLLYRGKDAPPAGSAQLGPGGRLLVSAPAGIHPGVEKLIEDLKARAPAPPPSVEVTYWALLGRPAETTEAPPGANEIAPALKAIVDADGPLKFELLEKQRVRSLSGEDVQVEGREMRVHHVASARGDAVLARVRIRQERLPGAVDTTVQVPAGELVVLGQSGVELPGEARGRAHLYYVVRARVSGAAAE